MLRRVLGVWRIQQVLNAEQDLMRATDGCGNALEQGLLVLLLLVLLLLSFLSTTRPCSLHIPA